ncbi:hypothetical protein SAMN05216345_10839 [Cupriavidus sp. YR651]|uniref:hypothetical protein n=1 Tax=Cupriavidus sp. YR651 TaxID=1855315 RepID=UPI00088AA14E|nr:hypothetical protein [Cupriavidus sp. YR651]SDD34670.1 hypothetical protein SAMN05216345_10839 [Cupriavidus sp. YR651]
MSKFQVAAPAGLATTGPQSSSPDKSRTTHRLRAVVATYRAALQAYTLVVSPDELMLLSNGPEPAHSARDYRAQAHLDRLRDTVRESGLALPNAIVVAVSGGRMQCECDHLYALELRPQAGDSLIVLDGHAHLAALAGTERGHIKTLVTAVLCRTAIQTGQETKAPVSEAECTVMHASAAARWAGATRIWQ